jgi:hypothetical protein
MRLKLASVLALTSTMCKMNDMLNIFVADKVAKH